MRPEKILLVAALFPLVAGAELPAPAKPAATNTTVVVIRGTQQGYSDAREVAPKPGRAAPSPGERDSGVIVMRPADASFMRGTTRMAAEAEAREKRVAEEEARERDLQLTRTLRAVEAAARAAENEARTRSERYYPVYVPRPRPPEPPGNGAPDRS